MTTERTLSSEPRGRRAFTAAKDSERCRYDITLKDGSRAQCMRRQSGGQRYCKQHQQVIYRTGFGVFR